MEKMTFIEVLMHFRRHNEKSNEKLTAVAVFKQSSFAEGYSELSRSYRFSSDNEAFEPQGGGNAIYADCLDGSEKGVRLDNYLYGVWEVDYCYLEA